MTAATLERPVEETVEEVVPEDPKMCQVGSSEYDVYFPRTRIKLFTLTTGKCRTKASWRLHFRCGEVGYVCAKHYEAKNWWYRCSHGERHRHEELIWAPIA